MSEEIPTYGHQKSTKNNDLTLKIRVRYSECDAQNVVFNARYAEYADLASSEYINALVDGYENLLKAGFDIQVVSLKIDWQNSAKFNDVLVLTVSPQKIGNTSFCLHTQCDKISDDGQTISLAQMSVTYVVVDTKDFKKAPIPDFMRTQFSRVFSLTVDQTGL